MNMRMQAETMIHTAIGAVLPDAAVIRALEGKQFPGRVILVAVGKAAWQMAKAAKSCCRLDGGIVITKYGHVREPLEGLDCREAGHPIPDENSFAATQAALELTENLKERDTVLFLLSGGGSALFEKPLISGAELQDITAQLLSCGAEITEINTIRKRLSAVKGGRFAQHCAPAQVFSVVLSDIIGDPLDMIASGPAYPDSSTCGQALAVAEKYGLRLSDEARRCLERETPKVLTNVQTQITGSVRELCAAAASAAENLGYVPYILTDRLNCQAKEAGAFLGAMARTYHNCGKKLAFLAGGETVVKLTGSGKGGRNQELALSAAAAIEGLENVCIFSIGSDGTDGPTDAAGGYADGKTAQSLRQMGISIHAVLQQNDAYHTLQKTGGLIITGPTGTNVNDVAVVLIG
ncbi:MAG: glycerate kinase [Oscillospiraceae bacterium]|nr:glycerate kinase [Oscillospiraceae bacterium]